MFNSEDVIHCHSRADLLADGDLVDVSSVAREAGFRFPVALSRSVMADCVLWPADAKARKPGAAQDESGRLWDVLYMAYLAVRKASADAVSPQHYTLYRVPAEGAGTEPVEVTLAIHLGAGDAGEGVITIMQVGED
jgi:hypothetical protein